MSTRATTVRTLFNNLAIRPKRAGRWLKQLSAQHQAPTFDLEKFITHWDEDLAPPRSFRQN